MDTSATHLTAGSHISLKCKLSCNCWSSSAWGSESGIYSHDVCMQIHKYVMVMLWNVDNALQVSGWLFELYLLQGQHNLEDWWGSVQCFQGLQSYKRAIREAEQLGSWLIWMGSGNEAIVWASGAFSDCIAGAATYGVKLLCGKICRVGLLYWTVINRYYTAWVGYIHNHRFLERFFIRG